MVDSPSAEFYNKTKENETKHKRSHFKRVSPVTQTKPTKTEEVIMKIKKIIDLTQPIFHN